MHQLPIGLTGYLYAHHMCSEVQLDRIFLHIFMSSNQQSQITQSFTATSDSIQLLSTQNTNVFDPQCTFLSSIKVKKVKVHTLDMAPLHSDSPPQKRSGMTRVLKGFHTFTCTPTRSSAIGMSHTCLCLPSRSWYSFTDPRRDGRLSRQDISSIRP